MKTRKVEVIDVQDLDELVEKTYGRPYSYQQQDGCKGRGMVKRREMAKDMFGKLCEISLCRRCRKEKVYRNENYHQTCVRMKLFNNDWCYVCNTYHSKPYLEECKKIDEEHERLRVWCGNGECLQACTLCPEAVCRSKDPAVLKYYNESLVQRRKDKEEQRLQNNRDMCDEFGHDWQNYPETNYNRAYSVCKRDGCHARVGERIWNT